MLLKTLRIQHVGLQALEDRLQGMVEPQLAAALAKHDGMPILIPCRPAFFCMLLGGLGRTTQQSHIHLLARILLACKGPGVHFPELLYAGQPW